MIVVMAILGIVMSSLTGVFVSGSNAELDLNRRFQAQQQARLALDQIRGDIHCASQVQAYSSINGYPGIKLAVGNCSAVFGVSTLVWCVEPSASMPSRYSLWRSTIDTTASCTSTDTTKQQVADYLTMNTVSTSSCPTGSNVFGTCVVNNGMETVSVDFPVSVNPNGGEQYELKDQIVARNWSPRCPATGSCATPTVP
jgi:type II secretory pathway pseudopilin PulG